MGLRTRLALLLMGLAALAGVAGFAVLRSNLLASYEAIERESSAGALRQLIQAVDGDLLQLDQVLREWSNWSEMQQYVRQRSAAFARDNLSGTSVASSGLVWLGVFDVAGRLIYQGHSPGNRLLQDDLTERLSKPGELRSRLANPPPENAPECGLLPVRQQVYMVCRRPVRDTEGRGDFVGSVVVMRPFDEQVQAELTQITQLRFSLTLSPGTGSSAQGEAMAFPVSGMVTPGPAWREVGVDTEWLRVPVADFMGNRFATLELVWPRVTVLRGREVLQQTLWLLIGVGLAVWIGLVVAIDRMIAVRLVRLQGRLQDIERRSAWDQRLDESGRDEIGQLARLVNAMLTLVDQQMRELSRLSLTDPLTGLPNRRRFDEAMEQGILRRQRNGRGMALVLLDVDYFKAYNDRLGHAGGDDALRVVAAALRSAVGRPDDLPSRTGGEEFALLLPDVGREGALSCAARALHLVRERALPHPDSPHRVLTVSAGVAVLQPGESAQQLYERADEALYQAKHAGRDQVWLSPASGATTLPGLL